MAVPVAAIMALYGLWKNGALISIGSITHLRVIIDWLLDTLVANLSEGMLEPPELTNEETEAIDKLCEIADVTPPREAEGYGSPFIALLTPLILKVLERVLTNL